MFRTHFWRTLIFSIVGALLGLLIALVSPKLYEANAELLVGERPTSQTTGVLDPQVVRILEQGNAADTQTELQLLRSQTVFFNAYRNALTKRNADATTLQDWLENYLRYDVISVEQRANAQEAGGVALIRVRMTDRELAEEVADEITRVYNEIRLVNARSSSANALRYLNDQVNSAKNTLDQTEKAYKDFTNTNTLVDVGVTLTSLTSRYNTTLANLQAAEQALEGARAEAAALRSQMSSMPETVASASSDQKANRISYLENSIAQARADLARARTRYFDDHVRVAEAREALNKLESDLKAEVRKGQLEKVSEATQRNPVRDQLLSQIASAEARANSLQEQVVAARAQVSEAEGQLDVLPGQEAQLRQLRRDLDVADSNYRRIKVQFDELNNRKDVLARTAIVLSPAQAFVNPVAPDTSKFVFIGLIAGICVGLLFSFAFESFKPGSHSSAQLSELTGVPVLATLPRMRGQSKTVAALAAPGSKPSESFRAMAHTMLQRTGEQPIPKSVLFTAAGSAPGRSSSVLQFAMSAAAMGPRVLVVDCDMIRGQITKAFGAEGRGGVSEIFDRSTLPGDGADLFIPTVHENVTVLPAGTNREKMLGDRTVGEIASFLAFLQDKADLVILDLPPCDLFADASRLAAYVDECILVVSASNTTYNAIVSSQEILNRAGAKHVAMVLTDATASDEPFADVRRYRRAG